MSNWQHNIRQVCNGTRTVDNQTKYRMMNVGIACIHLIFAFSFFSHGVMPMVWYNIGVIVFYLLHTFVFLPKEKYMFVFYSSIVEIVSYSAISSILFGWDWGFTMYTLAMIPASFYLTYALPGLKERISIPIITSIVTGASFILVRVACGRIEPNYQNFDTGNLQICLYYFNIIIAFVMLVLFSSLFALEINYMQRQLEMENRMLGEAANYDPLTRLLNRRCMNERLKEVLDQAEQQGQQFCIMLVDIDDFKKVNDTYGHDCGDEVLIAIANAIATDVREEDSVCRWGGEEILILIKAELDVARKVAERIRKDVMNTVVKQKDARVRVTLTIGVADYKKKQTIRAMIEEADRNMYYGKANGKNQVVTSHERLED
ncbi:MAG: GGDEF domain-containing protein [Lachnospiraceae bacterium]|nr:GGDEF domain-containing protein [Lachnospiraceae bacterium]